MIMKSSLSISVSLIMSIQCDLDSHGKLCYIRVCFLYTFCGGIGRSQDERMYGKIMFCEVLTMKIEHVQTKVREMEKNIL